jgi:uncharacterized membrane protein
VQDNKLMAILAYIIFFVPLLAGAHKNSPFVRFHANQGTVLFISCLIFGVLYGIIISVLTGLLLTTGAWGLLGIVGTVLGLVWLLPAILYVLGIINAATGKTKPLPVIGKFTLIK